MLFHLGVEHQFHQRAVIHKARLSDAADFQRLLKPFAFFRRKQKRILIDQPFQKRLPRRMAALAVEDAENGIPAFVGHHARKL